MPARSKRKPSAAAVPQLRGEKTKRPRKSSHSNSGSSALSSPPLSTQALPAPKRKTCATPSARREAGHSEPNGKPTKTPTSDIAATSLSADAGIEARVIGLDEYRVPLEEGDVLYIPDVSRPSFR